MIPLVLTTGFLGSGKTTLLRRIAEQEKGLKLVFLVNEFSQHDVDAKLLDAEGLKAVSVAGGSIFCRCRVTDFIRQLEAIPELFGTPEAPVAAVVVEASGIADPMVVQQMLAETRLDRIYRLCTVVTVVDPKSFLKLVHTLPNILTQVRAADRVILNKVDLCTPAEVRATRAEIERIRPGARVLETSFCEADLDLFGALRERSLAGEYAKCVDPNYASLALRFRGLRGPGGAGGRVAQRGRCGLPGQGLCRGARRHGLRGLLRGRLSQRAQGCARHGSRVHRERPAPGGGPSPPGGPSREGRMK